MNLPQDLLNTILYFQHFDYAPSIKELRMFYPKKITEASFIQLIDRFTKSGQLKLLGGNSIKHYSDNPIIYTPMGYSMSRQIVVKRKRKSEMKLMKSRLFLILLTHIPSVLYVGLTGSLAMHSAQAHDDIDLFIITSKKRMWLTRFILKTITFVMGQKRPRLVSKMKASNKICLNMFFDERELRIPIERQNEYIAHELLQTKTLIDKDNLFKKLLQQNQWVYRYFPNAKDLIKDQTHCVWINDVLTLPRIHTYLHLYISRLTSIYVFRITLDAIEVISKRIQMLHMRGVLTTETVTDRQLWFFTHYDRKTH